MQVKLEQARALAEDLLREHGLLEWTFKFDQAKRRFGSCRYHTKTITLSKHLTQLNAASQVRETLLHEIAHALTPGTGHGEAWREKCEQLGIAPHRCYRAEQVEQPPPRYLLVCDRCGLQQPRYRRSRTQAACKRCCVKYNGGRYSEKYRLRLELYTPG